MRDMYLGVVSKEIGKGMIDEKSGLGIEIQEIQGVREERRVSYGN